MLLTPSEVDDLEEAINLSREELQLRRATGDLPDEIQQFYGRLCELQDKIDTWRECQVIPE